MKKKIIICVYIVMLLIASKLFFTYIYNEYVISKYEDGDYDVSMSLGMACNWIQPYIAHYNAGNLHYKNKDYDAAIEEYKIAMDKEPKSDHKCDIRINMALAMVYSLPEEYGSEENIENSIKVLEEAREVLIADDCAKDKEDGHSKEATKLRKEIDAMLEELNQAGGSGEGGDPQDPGKDPGDEPQEPESGQTREEEIKNRVNKGKGQTYKDRIEDEDLFKPINDGWGNYGEEPIW